MTPEMNDINASNTQPMYIGVTFEFSSRGSGNKRSFYFLSIEAPSDISTWRFISSTSSIFLNTGVVIMRVRPRIHSSCSKNVKCCFERIDAAKENPDHISKISIALGTNSISCIVFLYYYYILSVFQERSDIEVFYTL
jgi:hypothetical protein